MARHRKASAEAAAVVESHAEAASPAAINWLAQINAASRAAVVAGDDRLHVALESVAIAAHLLRVRINGMEWPESLEELLAPARDLLDC